MWIGESDQFKLVQDEGIHLGTECLKNDGNL